jgi:Cytidylate kinase-like family
MQWRAVTISRQAGTGGHLVAHGLAEQLQVHAPEGAVSWIVFDRNLIEKVLSDYHLPAHMARFMPEDRFSSVQDIVDELCGLHPPTWTLVEKTSDTMLRLAELGNVILLGRGGNIVTSKLTHVFHVRLIGALEARIEFVQADRKLDRKTALELINQEDEGRRRYLKTYFHRDIDDPRLYHLVINTPVVGHGTAAKLIADAILSNSERQSVLQAGLLSFG